jgi:hypothetical protein
MFPICGKHRRARFGKQALQKKTSSEGILEC